MEKKTKKGKKRGRARILLMASDLPKARAYKTLENLNFKIIDYPAESLEDYEVEKIVEFAKKNKSDLILPMWSQSSENYRLSQACEREGIIFIGPQWEVLRIAGNKQISCKFAEVAGLPVLPGGPAKSAEEAAEIADKIGYPIIIKADESGGGLAMDVAESPKKALYVWEKISNKISVYFPDSTISIQKFVEKAAHLEIQIAGDKCGNIFHLGARNCSYQLNRQKRIEESHGVISDEARKYLCDLAVLLGRHLYTNAGYIILATVEFIVDPRGNAYFIEMNGRIQVEHRVTEQVLGHGLDLVELQIALAKGESLLDIFPGGQAEIDARIREGRWSVNARVYAEEPGIIEEFFLSKESVNVCIDTHISSGLELSLSKNFIFHLMNVTAFGVGEHARKDAIGILVDTLKNVEIKGVKTNVGKQIKALTHPDFMEGYYTTELYSKILDEYANIATARHIQRRASPSAWKLFGHIESMRKWPTCP